MSLSKYRMDRCGLHSSGSGQGQLVGPVGNGSEPPGSIKFREFLE